MTVAIPPLPGPVPQASDPVNFDTRADALLTALPGTITAMNAQNAENNAINAGLPATAAAAANAAAVAAVAVGMATKLNTANPSYTGTLTGGTGVINIGGGQVYKDAAGNLGLGTSSPTGRLTVEGALSVATLNALTLRNSLDGGVGLYFDNAVSNNLASIEAQVAGAGTGTDDGILSFSTATNGVNIERMRIDYAGNLGLGTLSPSSRLSVVDANNSYAGFFKGNAASQNFVALGTTSGGASIAGYTPGFAAPSDLIANPAGGNLGLGVTPSAWNSDYKVHQIGKSSAFFGRLNSNQTGVAENCIRGGDGSWSYLNSAPAQRYEQDSGIHYWYTAPSGTAGNPISFTSTMQLDAAGNLTVGGGSIEYGSGIKNLVLEGSGGAAFVANYNAGTVRSVFYADSVGSGIGTNTSHPLLFRTGGSERARIDSSGNLLVGTTSAVEKLTLSGRAFLANQTEPATPTSGGVIYVESGALKYKGSSGTATTLAPA